MTTFRGHYTRRHLQPIPPGRLTPMAQGHAAKASGMIKECPYSAGTKRRQWLRGWRLAERDGVGD